MGKWPTNHLTTYGGSPVMCDAKTLDLTIDGTNAAGVYTASFLLPPGAIVLDVGAHAVALWNAGTSAVMNVGDATDPNGYYAAVDMKATDLLAGEGISLDAAGGVEGADVGGTLTHFNRRWSATLRTISFVLTTVGTVPTTGETICYVTWANSSDEGTIKPPLGTYVAT